MLTDTQGMPSIGPLTSNVNLAIGRGSNTAWFSGLIDEARVCSVPLTASWIATEHANLTDTTFVAFGAQDAL